MVNVGVVQIAERLIQKFDDEPELKARIAQALLEVDHDHRSREIAYRLDPVLWVREVLGVTPHAWQERFLRAPRGRCIAAKTARQVGKSTVAAWGMAHSALFAPGSLSVVAAINRSFRKRTAKQAAEPAQYRRDHLLQAPRRAPPRDFGDEPDGDDVIRDILRLQRGLNCAGHIGIRCESRQRGGRKTCQNLHARPKDCN